MLHLQTTHLSPDELLIAAKVSVDPDSRAGDLAAAIDAAEARVRAAVPLQCVIYLEPDVDRAG